MATKKTKSEIRTFLDNALMECEALIYRRNNGLIMRGWQNVGKDEGIKIVINNSNSFFGDCEDYDTFYNVITLTKDNKFKVNIWDKKRNCLSDFIERENKYRESVGDELLETEFEDVVDALILGHEIIEYWDLEEDNNELTLISVG